MASFILPSKSNLSNYKSASETGEKLLKGIEMKNKFTLALGKQQVQKIVEASAKRIKQRACPKNDDGALIEINEQSLNDDTDPKFLANDV